MAAVTICRICLRRTAWTRSRRATHVGTGPAHAKTRSTGFGATGGARAHPVAAVGCQLGAIGVGRARALAFVAALARAACGTTVAAVPRVGVCVDALSRATHIVLLRCIRVGAAAVLKSTTAAVIGVAVGIKAPVEAERLPGRANAHSVLTRAIAAGTAAPPAVVGIRLSVYTVPVTATIGRPARLAAAPAHAGVARLVATAAHLVTGRFSESAADVLTGAEAQSAAAVVADTAVRLDYVGIQSRAHTSRECGAGGGQEDARDGAGRERPGSYQISILLAICEPYVAAAFRRIPAPGMFVLRRARSCCCRPSSGVGWKGGAWRRLRFDHRETFRPEARLELCERVVRRSLSTRRAALPIRCKALCAAPA